MTETNKKKLAYFFTVILPITLVIIFMIGFIIFEIILWVQYGGKPLSEIPTWALWFMFGGGRRQII